MPRCPKSRVSHFNPRSPHGERRTGTTSTKHTASIFQSTLPARGATSDRWQMYHNCQAFQSTLPARGATPPKHGSTRIPGISIHAPRTGSDRDWKRGAENPERISIHAPRTGSDDISAIAKDKYNQFQSTLPARGATDAGTKRGTSGQFQSTLPARGATHEMRHTYISIIFQSTLPARGATRWHFAAFCGTMNFNPRSPHGERLLAAYGFRMAGVFQSTLPARGATDADVLFLCNVEFQSTLPARGATHAQKAVVLTLPISIHAPRTGSDTVLAPSRTQSNDFNPRSPHGERLDSTAPARR